MPAGPIWSSVTIAVGTYPNHLTHIRLSHHMRERCLKLGALAPGDVLPNVEVHPFCILLAYLNGDESLSVFKRQATDPSFLLIFAHTWALAARLSLRMLQNELISVMSKLYTVIDEGTCSYQRCTWTDIYLLQAFQHIRSQFGPETHAENFLVCFSSRTAPLIGELEKQLRSKDFDFDIREKILKEARSFERDPIIHCPHIFHVSTLNPPSYPPLDVQRLPQDESSNADATRLHSNTSSSATNGRFNSSERNYRSSLEHEIRILRESGSPHATSESSNISYQRQANSKLDSMVHLTIRDQDAPDRYGPLHTQDPGDTSSSVMNEGRKLNLGYATPEHYLPMSHMHPTLPPSSAMSPSACHIRIPCMIQILQKNNEPRTDNSNRFRGSNDDKKRASPSIPGVRENSSDTARVSANNARHGERVTREKRRRRYRWFSLLTCGVTYQ